MKLFMCKPSQFTTHWYLHHKKKSNTTPTPNAKARNVLGVKNNILWQTESQ